MLLASRMNCRRGAPSRFDTALAGGLAAAIALTGAQSQALAQTAPAEGWQFEASSYARLFGLDCLSLHALRYRGAGGHPLTRPLSGLFRRQFPLGHDRARTLRRAPLGVLIRVSPIASIGPTLHDSRSKSCDRPTPPRFAPMHSRSRQRERAAASKSRRVEYR